ncbi:MAG TPA: CHRD domain-containing protein [Burkholderiales bacterium]|nr:CHRD domain-containing protein [Burkholderiales bacterium]
MKTLAIATALGALFATGIASADDKIRATLKGFNEVPSVSTEGSGTFDAVINRNGDAIDFEITYTGIQGTVTQSHMHVGQRGVNGGIVLWICGTATNPLPANAGNTNICTSPNGHFTGTWTGANMQNVATQQLATGELDEVIAAIRAGVAYVNVHSNLSPGGEIRGQVRADRRGHD